MSGDVRPDLLDAMLRSCWLVECARARVYTAWGPAFSEQAHRTGRRVTLAEAALAARDIPAPVAVLDAHTEWLTSVVGAAPDAVPLGAALLQRLGEWTNVYLVDHLPSDPAEFLALGEGDLLFPVPPRDATEAERFIDDVPPGGSPRFAIITDTHIGAEGADDVLRAVVRDVNAVEPDFVVVPGDVTDDGEPEQFELAAEILSGLDAPVHAVLGNHDAVRRSTRRPEGAALFERAFGRPPADVVLTCGGWQVALVDSTDPVPSPFPDWDLARGGFREDAGGTNNGALRDGQAEALAAAADPDGDLLVVLHHELQPFGAFPPVMFGLRDEDSDGLLSALAGHRLRGVIAGHTHRSALTAVAGGVPQLEIPSAKDWPFCFTVVSLHSGRPHVVVRQISDRDLVSRRAAALTPIYRAYVTGPRAALEHTF